MKFLYILGVLCCLAIPGAALDRESFTFTHYDLTVSLDPPQQRLGVRGVITLRNDSEVPQQNLSLQISSSLTWRSIQLDHEPLEFVSQSYTSDIDHTGSLSEAIVTLPKVVPPQGVLKLTIGYEGTIPVDATRLIRIGVPEKTAKDTDWDRISEEFTVVRGIGYVTWYPIALNAANLSELNSVFAAAERWKLRQSNSSMSVSFDVASQRLYFSGVQRSDPDQLAKAAYDIPHFGMNVPVFAVGDYKTMSAKNESSINYFAGSEDAARDYINFFDKLRLPMLRSDAGLQVVQLLDPGAAAFISGSVLLTPLNSPIPTDAMLNIVYALALQSPTSQRTWIHDGLAHYAQLSYIEQRGKRQLVLDYLDTRLPLLTEEQKVTGGAVSPAQQAAGSLINSGDDPKSQVKAMWVWWMLQDMCGDSIAADSMANYQQAADKEPSYMQRIVEKACKKDLEWFFDDWIYRDEGLPDLHVTSVYPRKNLRGGYLTTVTIENLGSAAAEVPVTIHDTTGDFTERVLVKGKSKASVRFATINLPDQVKVNDGSVPESDINNNTFTIEPASVDTH
jgi:hypothetical protein